MESRWGGGDVKDKEEFENAMNASSSGKWGIKVEMTC